jgi:hypothetical protein
LNHSGISGLSNKRKEIGMASPDSRDRFLVSGGLSFIFEPLKLIPVQLVFYPADDEFSAGGSILLDASATEFLGFETLAFLMAS